MTDVIQKTLNYVYQFLPEKKEYHEVIVKEITEAMPSHGVAYQRIAGLSGAIAVAMGAYGAHVFRHTDTDTNMKLTYETGNRYHFMHSIALLSVPLTRRPHLVGSLMLSGMVLFSGSCYYHALTGNTLVRKVTPYGGLLLIAAWLSIIL